MKSFCWEYFKKTGDIQACTYMLLSTDNNMLVGCEKREIKDSYAFEYGWNSFKVNKVRGS